MGALFLWSILAGEPSPKKMGTGGTQQGITPYGTDPKDAASLDVSPRSIYSLRQTDTSSNCWVCVFPPYGAVPFGVHLDLQK